jgi:hypothetical protein
MSKMSSELRSQYLSDDITVEQLDKLMNKARCRCQSLCFRSVFLLVAAFCAAR